MGRTVLLATDLDRRTDRALDRAVELAAEWKARLVIVHAVEGSVEGWRPAGREDPRTVAAARIRADLREPLPDDLEIVVERGDPVTLVLDTIRRVGCQLVVTGVARDTRLGRASAGATVDALARLSPVPVLAVKSRAVRAYRNIVIASDFSEPSRDALRTASELFPSAHLVLFHAYHVLYEGFIDNKCAARDAEARHAAEKARAFLAETALGDRHVEIRTAHGAPEHALHELVDAGGADLVVVGTRGRGTIGQLLLGSVARSIVAEVPADVLIASNRAMTG